MQKLRLLLTEQQRAAVQQSKLMQELDAKIKLSAQHPLPAQALSPPPAASLTEHLAAQPSETLSTVAAAERRALEQVRVHT